MARTPEGKVKDAVTKILQMHNAYYFFPMMGGFGRSGVPDIIVCFKGFFIGIECKSGTNTPTALQLSELSKIDKAGGISMVINEQNVDWVHRTLETLGALKSMESAK